MTADNLVKTGNVPAGAQAGPFGTRWWRNWFDHSPDAQFVLDTAGIVECNAQALRVLGRVDKSRVLGREPASLSPETQPDGSRSDAGIAGRYGRPDLTVKFDWVTSRSMAPSFPSRSPLPRSISKAGDCGW